MLMARPSARVQRTTDRWDLGATSCPDQADLRPSPDFERTSVCPAGRPGEGACEGGGERLFTSVGAARGFRLVGVAGRRFSGGCFCRVLEPDTKPC